jgi:hypothetical protein
LIERAYELDARAGLAVWCQDEAGPFQAVPHPGGSWRPQGQPATRPHEYVRGGTLEVLTLFHPATGQVRVQPAASCTNMVLHGWLKETLAAIVAALPAGAEPSDPAATRARWQAWQEGLTLRFTLPEQLPPLRMLLVWDNLAGHKTPEMVLWLCRHRHHAALHALGRQLAEHGRVDPAHPQAPGARRAAAVKPRRDRRLVRADGRSVEPAADPLRVAWQAPAAATAAAAAAGRRSASIGRLRRLHATPAVSTTVGRDRHREWQAACQMTH